MSTADRPETDDPAASDAAARLHEAGFVQLTAAPTGDALAAAALLAGGLDRYQVTVGDTDRDTEADCTVAVGGAPGGDLRVGPAAPASQQAYEIARQLGVDPDPVLALAGTVAAGLEPTGPALEAAGVERRPGLALPTADAAAGLAATTLAHGPFSGDARAAAGTLDGADGDDDAARRRRASLAALAVAGDPDGTPAGAQAVERLLRPYGGGPFRTVGGYADVLDALARRQPGLGVATALGAADRQTALSGWRDHGHAAHRTLRAATTARYDGLVVVRADASDPERADPDAGLLGTVARLSCRFRAPEPAVLAVADGPGALYATGEADAAAVLDRALADAGGGRVLGTAREAQTTADAEPTALAAAVREAV